MRSRKACLETSYCVRQVIHRRPQAQANYFQLSFTKIPIEQISESQLAHRIYMVSLLAYVSCPMAPSSFA